MAILYSAAGCHPGACKPDGKSVSAVDLKLTIEKVTVKGEDCAVDVAGSFNGQYVGFVIMILGPWRPLPAGAGRETQWKAWIRFESDGASSKRSDAALKQLFKLNEKFTIYREYDAMCRVPYTTFRAQGGRFYVGDTGIGVAITWTYVLEIDFRSRLVDLQMYPGV